MRQGMQVKLPVLQVKFGIRVHAGTMDTNGKAVGYPTGTVPHHHDLGGRSDPKGVTYAARLKRQFDKIRSCKQ